jgi:hypothetical protein
MAIGGMERALTHLAAPYELHDTAYNLQLTRILCQKGSLESDRNAA